MYSPLLSTAQDLRAVRTRQVIRRALPGLLKSKPLDQITNLINRAFQVLESGTARDAAIALFTDVDQHRAL
jgi:hypothetical protein